MTIQYANAEVRNIVKLWKPTPDFDAEGELKNHIEQKFAIDKLVVLNAKVCENFILLLLQSTLWKEPREFGLLNTGSLAW